MASTAGDCSLSKSDATATAAPASSPPSNSTSSAALPTTMSTADPSALPSPSVTVVPSSSQAPPDFSAVPKDEFDDNSVPTASIPGADSTSIKGALRTEYAHELYASISARRLNGVLTADKCRSDSAYRVERSAEDIAKALPSFPRCLHRPFAPSRFPFFEVSVHQDVGTRKAQEDRFVVCPKVLADRDDVAFFGVFDGTVGDYASDTVQHLIVPHLLASPPWSRIVNILQHRHTPSNNRKGSLSKSDGLESRKVGEVPPNDAGSHKSSSKTSRGSFDKAAPSLTDSTSVNGNSSDPSTATAVSAKASDEDGESPRSSLQQSVSSATASAEGGGSRGTAGNQKSAGGESTHEQNKESSGPSGGGPSATSQLTGGSTNNINSSSSNSLPPFSELLSLIKEDEAGARYPSTTSMPERDFINLMSSAINWTYLNSDVDLVQRCAAKSAHYASSTAVTVLLLSGWCVVAHLGDSRAAVGIYRGGSMFGEFLTSDHKPNQEKEFSRIINSGGSVEYLHNHSNKPFIRGGDFTFRKARGEQPMQLQYSRAFGGKDLKMFGLSNEPDVLIFRLNSEHKLFILASDGLWDVQSAPKAVDIVLGARKRGENPARALVNVTRNELKAKNQNADNITAIVIFMFGESESTNPTAPYARNKSTECGISSGSGKDCSGSSGDHNSHSNINNNIESNRQVGSQTGNNCSGVE